MPHLPPTRPRSLSPLPPADQPPVDRPRVPVAGGTTFSVTAGLGTSMHTVKHVEGQNRTGAWLVIDDFGRKFEIHRDILTRRWVGVPRNA